jgi:Ca2+-binding RTX toxin-like protein
LIGSSDLIDPDVLVGLDQNAQWTIGAVDTYVSNSTLVFVSFETLMGGNRADLFNVSGVQDVTLIGGAGDDNFVMNEDAQLLAINGQSGFDTLAYCHFEAPIIYDIISGTASGISAGFNSIESIIIVCSKPHSCH